MLNKVCVHTTAAIYSNFILLNAFANAVDIIEYIQSKKILFRKDQVRKIISPHVGRTGCKHFCRIAFNFMQIVDDMMNTAIAGTSRR